MSAVPYLREEDIDATAQEDTIQVTAYLFIPEALEKGACGPTWSLTAEAGALVKGSHLPYADDARKRAVPYA